MQEGSASRSTRLSRFCKRVIAERGLICSCDQSTITKNYAPSKVRSKPLYAARSTIRSFNAQRKLHARGRSTCSLAPLSTTLRMPNLHVAAFSRQIYTYMQHTSTVYLIDFAPLQPWRQRSSIAKVKVPTPHPAVAILL